MNLSVIGVDNVQVAVVVDDFTDILQTAAWSLDPNVIQETVYQCSNVAIILLSNYFTYLKKQQRKHNERNEQMSRRANEQTSKRKLGIV